METDTYHTDPYPFEVFPWNRNFETGHAVIDRQHRKLVDLLNALAKTLINNEPIHINRAFDELAAYADQHFDTEDAIWLESFGDDAWLKAHRKSHASFMPKVLEMKQQEVRKPLPEVVEEIIKFLIRWLAFHIIDNDYSSFLGYRITSLPLAQFRAHYSAGLYGKKERWQHNFANFFQREKPSIAILGQR